MHFSRADEGMDRILSADVFERHIDPIDPAKPDYSGGVEIEAPARLHMGFLDLDGSLGRRFGSVGIGIQGLSTRLTARPSDRLTATGPEADRALSAIQRLAEVLDRPLTGQLEVTACVPPHAGLGSGTQIALAAGMAISQLHGLGLSAIDVAHLCGRGRRSGIGIACFEAAGLVVDAGRGHQTIIPPVISRLTMPPAWRFVILLDPHRQGLHGAEERTAFKELPPFPRATAAALCHALLMQGLPALIEQDLQGFGAVIETLQKTIGDHFAPHQGGRFSSRPVAEALEVLGEAGAHGMGQSSWGPTGFCLAESAAQAEALVLQLQTACPAARTLDVRVVAPCDRGAMLRPLPQRRESRA